MFLYLKSLRFLNVLSRYFLCWSAYPPMPGRENQLDIFQMLLQIQSPFLSQVSSGDQWWQYSDPQSCLSVDTGVIEKAWYNWGSDWEGLNQLRKWLRRPEPVEIVIEKAWTMQYVLQWSSFQWQLDKHYGQAQTILSNFYVSCVWKNLTRKGQLQKSHSFGGSTLLWIWILYLDGHSCPSQSSSCSLQVNTFTSSCLVWN